MPSIQLAVSACRWCTGVGDAEELAQLCGAQSNELVAIARRHRIPGILWQALQSSGCDLPAETAQTLTADARRNAEQSLAAAAMSQRLLDRFASAAIPILFLKGHTVGQLAWDNPFLKTSWDVDVLVLPGDLRRAGEALRDLGFELAVPHRNIDLHNWHRTHKESVWRSSDGLFLELHSRVADAPQLLPALDALSPRQDVAILPTITLPTFADDELFAYLCVHGASSAWFRLKWIADLWGLIRRRSAAEIEHLFHRSQQLDAGRAAHQALLLAAWLFGPLASPSLQVSLEGDRVAVWLARLAARQLLKPREPTQRPLGTATIHLSQMALLPGPGFAASELMRQVRAAGG